MPSFGGTSIFGTAVSMSTADNPRESQLNTFFGLSGLESLDGGMRGRWTQVTGLLFGNSPGALATAEALFRSFNDGTVSPSGGVHLEGSVRTGDHSRDGGECPVREITPCLGATSSTSAGTPSSTISAVAA